MMSRGINKVILVGNLGSEPEARKTPSGVAVTNFTLATASGYKNKETDSFEMKTEWHKVVFFNRVAEVAAQYLHKGSKVYVEGSLKTRKWQDKNGQDRYTTEIVGGEMQMLDSKQTGVSLDKSTPEQPYDKEKFKAVEFDDDIPF